MRPVIEVLTAQYLTFGITEFSETTVAFYGNEDLLIDEGTYVMVYGKENTRDAGKYVNIWRKEDGEWRLYSNMWNSNAPTAPARRAQESAGRPRAVLSVLLRCVVRCCAVGASAVGDRAVYSADPDRISYPA